MGTIDSFSYPNFLYLRDHIADMGVIDLPVGQIFVFPPVGVNDPKSDDIVKWTSGNSYLYVRPSYFERLEMLRYVLKLGSVTKEEESPTLGSAVTITGKEGIGKSFFLIYLIAFFLYDSQLYRDQPRSMGYRHYDRWIIYQSGEIVQYAFNPIQGTATNDRMVINSLYNLGSTWILFNLRQNQILPSSSARIICVAPYKNCGINSDSEKHSQIRWMSCWDHKEVAEAAPYVYPRLSVSAGQDPQMVGVARCLERYRLYGGIARIVFANKTDTKLKNNEEKALNGSGLWKTLEAIYNNAVLPEMQLQLLNYEVTPLYRSEGKNEAEIDSGKVFEKDYEEEEEYSIGWINDRVAALVLSALTSTQIYEMSKHLGLHDSPALNGLRSLLLEPFAKEQLVAGKTFRVRLLGKGKEDYTVKRSRLQSLLRRREGMRSQRTAATQSIEQKIVDATISREENAASNCTDWVFEAKKEFYFDELSLVPVENTSDFLVPNQKDYKVTDFISFPNVLFQVTVSLHHPIKEGVQELVDVLQQRIHLANIPPHHWFSHVPIIFFVVPEEVFDTFANTPKEREVCPDELFRFVLCLPYNFRPTQRKPQKLGAVAAANLINNVTLPSALPIIPPVGGVTLPGPAPRPRRQSSDSSTKKRKLN